MYINQFVMNFQSWCFPSFDKKETVSSFLLNIFAFVVCGIFWCVWYDFLHFFIAISKLPINSFIYIWSTAATVEALSFGITLVELWRKKNGWFDQMQWNYRRYFITNKMQAIISLQNAEINIYSIWSKLLPTARSECITTDTLFNKHYLFHIENSFARDKQKR